MNRIRIILISALFLALPAAGVAQGSSQARTDGEVSNIVQELSQEIESPYCPGKTLAMCPSGGAAEVRREIQRKAEDGMSKGEIKQAIIEEHGEEYRLREPPARDNYSMIAAVIVGLIICIGAVAYLTGRGDDDTDDEDPNAEDLSDEEELYLEELRSQYRE